MVRVAPSILWSILIFFAIGAIDAHTAESPASPASGSDAIALLNSPHADNTPIVVHLGLYVTDLSVVDEADESFEMRGYFFARWHDDRLRSGNTAASNRMRTLNESQIWSPLLQIVNLGQSKSYQVEMYCDNDGTVYWSEHLNAQMGNEYSLRGFPFDEQKLRITIQPFIKPATSGNMPIMFAPEDFATGVTNETYVGLSAWEIKRVLYHTDIVTLPGLNLTIPEATFLIVVKRRNAFYLWKVFFPLLLMVLVSWTVFWVTTEEFDWQMKIPIATMLSMIAFEFAIVRDLPRVGYITFVDATILTSFTFVFLTIIELIAVHVLIREKMEAAGEKIHKASRWAFPATYFVTLIILVLIFFRTGS